MDGGDSIRTVCASCAEFYVTPSSATPLDYDRLRDSLADAGTVVALAELHGGVCGALCAGDVPAAQRWLKDCLDDEDSAASPAAIAAELDEVLAASAAMLADPELAFQPLLPDDDAPLDEQVQALALWCQGFLSGVGTTAPGAAQQQDGPLGEILRDFAEISRAGLSEDEAAGRGQPDFALAEIHEYVRVSVQIVFDELEPARAGLGRDVH
jgi:yecA family protein